MAPASRVVKPRVGYTVLLHQPEDGRRYEIYDRGRTQFGRTNSVEPAR